MKVTATYLQFQSVEELAILKCPLWYIVPGQKTLEVCYQMEAGENLVKKDHRLQMQISNERL